MSRSIDQAWCDVITRRLNRKIMSKLEEITDAIPDIPHTEAKTPDGVFKLGDLVASYNNMTRSKDQAKTAQPPVIIFYGDD